MKQNRPSIKVVITKRACSISALLLKSIFSTFMYLLKIFEQNGLILMIRLRNILFKKGNYFITMSKIDLNFEILPTLIDLICKLLLSIK